MEGLSIKFGKRLPLVPCVNEATSGKDKFWNAGKPVLVKSSPIRVEAALQRPEGSQCIPKDSTQLDSLVKEKCDKVSKVAQNLCLGEMVRDPYFTGYPKAIRSIDIHGNGKWVFKFQTAYATYAPTQDRGTNTGLLEMTLKGRQYEQVWLPHHFRSIPISEGLMDWIITREEKLEILDCRPTKASEFPGSSDALVYRIGVLGSNNAGSKHSWVDSSGKPLKGYS